MAVAGTVASALGAVGSFDTVCVVGWGADCPHCPHPTPVTTNETIDNHFTSLPTWMSEKSDLRFRSTLDGSLNILAQRFEVDTLVLHNWLRPVLILDHDDYKSPL